jgi:hypothetical protein
MGESPFASAEVRQRIAAHNDWIFASTARCSPASVCRHSRRATSSPIVARGHRRRHGLPGVSSPSKVDHSVDDLLVRIGEL